MTTAPTAIAPTTPQKFPYTPLAPIEKPGNLKGLLEAQKDSIGRVIAKHMTPDRLATMFLTAATKTPDILRCTQESIARVAITAAELGLDISGTLGDAYVVPFSNKVQDQWRMTAQLIIGYRGLARLARQAGGVARIESNVVCENDEFDLVEGTEFRLTYRKGRGERGKAVGAYALVQFTDGSFQAEYMSRDDIEAVRNNSKSGKSPAWVNHWGEMARKTVFRRLAKWLPLSADRDAALIRATQVDDEDYDYDTKPTREPGTSGTATVRAALGIVDQSSVDATTGELLDAAMGDIPEGDEHDAESDD
jgi:recombination protein RecT